MPNDSPFVPFCVNLRILSFFRLFNSTAKRDVGQTLSEWEENQIYPSFSTLFKKNWAKMTSHPHFVVIYKDENWIIMDNTEVKLVK